MAGEHCLKTNAACQFEGPCAWGVNEALKEAHVPDHRPKRFSALCVSMVCMELCSTRTMGRAACRGMFAWGAVVAGGEDYMGWWVLEGVRFRRRGGDCVRALGCGCGLDDQAPCCYRAATHIEKRAGRGGRGRDRVGGVDSGG